MNWINPKGKMDTGLSRGPLEYKEEVLEALVGGRAARRPGGDVRLCDGDRQEGHQRGELVWQHGDFNGPELPCV